jgi:dTDP-4-dehydrorhamnose reductase
MNRALVTGLNGRLAPLLKEALASMGVEIVGFDRAVLDIEDINAQRDYLKAERVDCIFHLANGSENWVGILAGLAKEFDIPFLYTSTESVFEPTSKGPFTPEREADATGDYGAYKIRCERAALDANSDAIIARLGWQMFDTFEVDNLLCHVRDMKNEHGVIHASSHWLPAVAFVGHTMQCMLDLMDAEVPGIYHIGGNESGLSFFDLVNLINEHHQLGWDVQESEDPARDGRIIDDRVPCGRIEDVLAGELNESTQFQH